jgi:hypothetical protein
MNELQINFTMYMPHLHTVWQLSQIVPNAEFYNHVVETLTKKMPNIDLKLVRIT